MLEELRIKNLAVVEDVTLKFGRGLNVLTGSTGAGKSLVLGAVNLLLGERGSARVIRAGEERASVAGVFQLAPPFTDKLLACLSADGSHRIVLRRDIDRKGRSRAFINDRACTVKQLHDVSAQLIEPHGQNEQLQLRHAENHVVYVDKFAGNAEQRAAYRSALEGFERADYDLRAFEKRLELARERKELLEHRLEEIERADLKAGEKEALEESVRVLSHGQEIFEVLSDAVVQIYDDESSSLVRIAQIRKRLSRLAGLDKSLAGFAEQLDRAEIQLGETVADMRSFADRLDFDPATLEGMQQRLDFLTGLERRYQMPLDELRRQGERWSSELESLVFEKEDRDKLTKQRTSHLKQLRAAGQKLSKSRMAAAEILDKQMTAEIELLMLKGARFRTDFGYELDESSDIVIERQGVRPRSDGIDTVEFHVRTNPGEAEGSVSEIASSGELSRMALALKTVVNIGREGSVLVFDELDAGVGADMGDVMATKLETLAAGYQIICITHMPQIAARGVKHLVVKKTSQEGRTFTRVEPASGGGRVDEIARMLGGRDGSQKRLALAAEMLQSTKTSSDVRP